MIDNKKVRGDYYLKDYKEKEYLIERGITREIIKANVLKNERDIEKNTRRIIFPYIRIEGKAKIIPEMELKQNYPEAYKYLSAIKDELKQRDKGKKKYEIGYLMEEVRD